MCQLMREKEHREKYGEDLNEKYPLKRCLGFDHEGEPEFHGRLAKFGFSQEITKDEALDILKECNDLGMVQNAENSQKPIFMCNCPKEICAILESMRNHYEEATEFGETPNVLFSPSMPSPFVATIADLDSCVGCGKCEELCPGFCYRVDEVEQKTIFDGGQMCIGCGVCAVFCRAGVIEMRDRPEGDLLIAAMNIPENPLRRKIKMLTEMGMLHALLFNDDEKLFHRIMIPAFRMFERSWVGKKIFRNDSFREKLLQKSKKKISMKMKFEEEEEKKSK